MVESRLGRAAVACALFFVLLVHLRLARSGAYAHREFAVPASARLRSAVIRIVPEEQAQLVEITAGYESSARSPTEITLPFGRDHIAGVQLHDSHHEKLSIDAKGYEGHSTLNFSLPADRDVVLGFELEPLSTRTYGWGHRAVRNDWLTAFSEARVPVAVQIVVPSGTFAPGWNCSTGAPRELDKPAPRECVTQIKTQRTLALPVEGYDDALGRIGFAAAIGTVISALMYAIYRRWSDLAVRMGGTDEDLAKGPLTMEELGDYRRTSRPRASQEPDVDPLEGVALVARGISSVLSVIGSLFLVAHFGDGLFPIPAPLALTLWALSAGATMVVATGVDRPRPWLGLLLVAVLAGVGIHPLLRWVAPGLVPLVAGVTMQLTGSSLKAAKR